VIESKIFQSLCDEGVFTKEMLGAGATQIRNANYSKKGIYFQAFTSLSTGLERIAKLCVMLDYYLDKSSFSDENMMKYKIGHDLIKLYIRAKEVIVKRSLQFRFNQTLDEEIYQSILNILSRFAKGDRYSNINFLVNKQLSSSPIASWYKNVDLVIFKTRISSKKKDKIRKNADLINKMIGQHIFVRFIDESGKVVSNSKKASYLKGVSDAVAPYRQLFVLHIIRFWVELINELTHQCMKLGDVTFPYFSEIFASFYNPDSYLRTRKTWNKI
jgi:hypothetical protein